MKTLLTGLVGLSLVGFAHAQGAPTLFPYRWHELGLPPSTWGPLELVPAHLDGDAQVDLIVLSHKVFGGGGGELWYALRSDGAGEFTPTLDLGTRAPAGDLDGDGRIDLARSKQTSAQVATFEISLANGVGGFTHLPPQSIVGVVSDTPRWTAADIDNNGIEDLLSVRSNSDQVLMVRGDGAGGVSNLLGILHGGATLIDALAVDLEGDGDRDIVALRTSPPWPQETDRLIVMKSVGPGWFLAPTVEDELDLPKRVLAADLDLDGDIDLVHYSQVNSSLRYLEGDGAGGLAPAVAIAGTPSGAFPHNVVLADVDRDGSEDLLVDLWQTIGWARATSGQPPGPYQSLGPWFSSDLLAAFDLDQDGRDEWIARRTPGITVYDPDLAGPSLAFSKMPSSGHTLADFDADGRLDVALLAYPHDLPLHLETFLGSATGFTPGPAQPCPPPATTGWLGSADFDADGRIDLVRPLRDYPTSTDGIELMHGVGDGSFTVGAAVLLPQYLNRFAIGDFDSDGNADVLASQYPGGSSLDVRLYSMLGDGTGALGSPLIHLLPMQTATAHLELADFDADGVLDVLVETSNGKFAIVRGAGDGTWLTPNTYVGSTPTSSFTALAPGDFDGDGRIDVAGCTGTTGWWTRALSTGFDAPVVVATQPQGSKWTYRTARAGDIDRDGHNELLIGARYYPIPPGETDVGRLHVYRWSGNALLLHSQYSPGGQLATPGVVDFDGDGGSDLMMQVSHDNFLRWLIAPGMVELAAGLAPYGTGTPSCLGTITGVANLAPKVGESQFKLSWTNAPPNASALVGIAFMPDLAGSDVFAVGVNIHIHLLGPVLAYTVASDAGGAAKLAFPVPNAPALAGFQAYVQSLWIEPAWQSCSSSPFPWSSSTGLQVTVLP